MFLCLHNTLLSVLYLLEVFPGVNMTASKGTAVNTTGAVAAILVLLTALLAVLADLDMTVGSVLLLCADIA